jgi:sugar phosphate isomerase/epimerase
MAPGDLTMRILDCGLSAVQIALDPYRTARISEEADTNSLCDGGIDMVSGMMAMKGEDYSTLESIQRTGGVRLDEHWAENLAAANANADLAKSLRLQLVTFHAGFLPHDPRDPERARMLERLSAIAEAFGSRGIRVGLETGQESAETLLGVLADLRARGVKNLGVNFDPANMILYGMGNPIEALRRLAPHVVQIHIKDAIPTKVPGTWGEEVPAGTGVVDWPAFFKVYRDTSLACDLVIEREAGDDRVADIRRAASLVREHLQIGKLAGVKRPSAGL